MGSAEVVRVGMRTPWGTADGATVHADGIGTVGTPGHGGVKLSAARNRLVPAPLRREGGWYEEDCDAYIPMYVFPDAFPTMIPGRITLAEVWDGMRRWYPEQVDAAYPGGFPERMAAFEAEHGLTGAPACEAPALIEAAKESGRFEVHRVSPMVAVAERPIVAMVGLSSDPDRRALDAVEAEVAARVDDDSAALHDDAERCRTCRGLGLVRAVGKRAGGHYRTLGGAQAALGAGRAVDCPVCAGVGLTVDGAAI